MSKLLDYIRDEKNYTTYSKDYDVLLTCKCVFEAIILLAMFLGFFMVPWDKLSLWIDFFIIIAFIVLFFILPSIADIFSNWLAPIIMGRPLDKSKFPWDEC
jgi:formate hydrogenlyase subunit 4